MSTYQLEPCIKLPLEETVLKEIVAKAKDWALMHGAGMRCKTDFNEDVLEVAPFVLLPSIFPKREFEMAIKIQPVLNELIHKVAHDYEFLSTSLQSTIKGDEFTAQLFNIYKTVREEGISQPLCLGLIRSDIMLETTCMPSSSGCTDIRCSEKCLKVCERDNNSPPFCCWKQVEINTISSGFGWLGPISADIHRYVLQELGHMDKIKHLPVNNALEGLCNGMIKAWEMYENPKAVILFVVEDVTYNICDQRFHEFKIRELNSSVRVIRKNLTQISEEAKLTKTKELFIESDEIAVVYYRSGYVPNQHPSSKEWDARLIIERSKAIKCPSVQYQLAGTKKVQQMLAQPGILNRFLDKADQIEKIKEIFTGLYSFDQDNSDQILKMALETPEKFVLKPQREGGGNNIYGVEIRQALMNMTREEQAAWILMERILPPIQKNYMVRAGSTKNSLSDFVSELGIFGVIIGDDKEVLYNNQVGHMLRTKLSSSNEGGVAAGSGALDSPYLI